MAIIQELGLNLETLSALVQGVRAAIGESERAAAEARQALEVERTGLPQTAAATRAQFAEAVAGATRARTDLERLGTEVADAARRLGQEEARRVEALETRGAEAGARLEGLTGKVQGALRDVDARTGELQRAAKAAAAAVGSDTEALRAAEPPLTAALATADDVMQRAYRPATFDELETGLGGLRQDLETARGETVPNAAQGVVRHLQDQHGPEVEGHLAAFRSTAGEAMDGFAAAAAAASRKLLDAEAADFARVDAVLHTELPEAVRQAVDSQAVPALGRMAEEAAKTWRAAGNTSAWLNKAQDPWYPAVRELHIALRGMVKGG